MQRPDQFVQGRDRGEYSAGVQVRLPAAGPPLHSRGPQKLRQFLAVSGLPLTAVKSRDKKLLKGAFLSLTTAFYGE